MQIKYGAFVNVEAGLLGAQVFGHETVVVELLVKGTPGNISMSRSEAVALIEALKGAVKSIEPSPSASVNLGKITLPSRSK